jgi:hypothetical protein
LLFKILVPILPIFFIGCGGGGSSEKSSTPSTVITDQVEMVDSYNYSFDDVRGYAFNLGFKDNSILFELDEVGIDDNLFVRKFFDEDTGNYEIDTKIRKIRINVDEEIKSTQLDYRITNAGSIISSYNSKDIFNIYLVDKESYISNSLPEIDAENINLSGVRYSAIKEYLVDYYKIDGLASTDSYNNLHEFISVHKDSPFTGANYSGLLFDGDNSLLELRDNKYTEAGSYEIKTIKNQDIVFIYPDDKLNYDANGCYLFDDSYRVVLKATCYNSGDKEELYIYDENIYNGVIEYVQDLTDVNMTF